MGIQCAAKKKKRTTKNICISMEEDIKLKTAEVETNKDRASPKRKRKKEPKIDVVETVQIPSQDSLVRTSKKKRRVKSAENNDASLRNDDPNQENGRSKRGLKKKRRENSSKEIEKPLDKEETDTAEISPVPSTEDGLKRKKGKSKEAKKKKDRSSLKNSESHDKQGTDEDDVYLMSSGDEDSSKGMKKWISEYHESRPGIAILQQRIDEFITAHEEKLEKDKKEKEARIAEGGWTVVTHQKGRKKTTEAETGITVGSVSQAVVEGRLAKKKSNQVGLDFYRFQKKEAHRNDVMALQSKFKEDVKRLQQLRAARKFRPY